MPNPIALKDQSREGLTKAKFAQPFRLLRPKNNHAIAKVSAFRYINIQKINELLGLNIQGLILDVDECIAPHHGEILPENIEAITTIVQQGIKIVIYSNMEATDRYLPLIEAVKDQTGYLIRIMTNIPAKPDPRGFKACQESLELPPENIAMVGDNFITDGGAIGAGIKFIKVKPIKSPKNSGKRLAQKTFRGMFASLSDFYDLLGRKVLTDKDLSEMPLP